MRESMSNEKNVIIPSKTTPNEVARTAETLRQSAAAQQGVTAVDAIQAAMTVAAQVLEGRRKLSPNRQK